MNQSLAEPAKGYQLEGPAKDYLLEEQKQRRSDIEYLQAKIDDEQRYGLIITGAIWSWTATNQDKLTTPYDIMLALLALTLAVFFFWRSNILSDSIKRSAKYVYKLEARFSLPEGYGWEHWVENYRKEFQSKPSLKNSRKAFWKWLIFVNIALGIIFVWFGK